MKTRLLSIFFILICYGNCVLAQSGSSDPSFNPGDLGFGYGDGTNGSVTCSALQSDGKIIIGGTFTTYNGISSNRIARLNTDGTLDATFNVGTGFSQQTNSISIQSDGKVIVAGSFDTYNATASPYIARLNTNGSLDATFNSASWMIFLGASTTINTSKIQGDDKIVVGGIFNNTNGFSSTNIARFNSDGSEDLGFTPGTGANISVNTISIQSDNKIIIGGDFTNYNGTSINRIARLTTTGTLDGTFAVGAGCNALVSASLIQADGKIVIAGNFSAYSGSSRVNIVRINTDGTRDVTFAPGTGLTASAYALAIQTDGKIILGYSSSIFGNQYIVRFNTDGTRDVALTTSDLTPVKSILMQADGSIVIGGSSGIALTNSSVNRLTSTGSVDLTYNNVGTAAHHGIITSAIQSDGKILIGGVFRAYDHVTKNYIARLNTDGSLDATFNIGTGFDNYAQVIKIQSDGKILVGGGFTAYNGTAVNRIVRLNTDGSIDAAFNVGTGADAVVYSILVQSDNKILIGGFFTDYNGTAINHLARLNTDGSIDNTFNIGTGTTSLVSAIAQQVDGKIIIGGSFTNYNGTTVNRITRLNTNGSLDGTFNSGSALGTAGTIYSCHVLSSGKILISGSFGTYNGTARKGIALLNSDGSLDTGFDPGTGANTTVYASAVLSNGKIIIAGTFTSYNGTPINRIARINTDGSIDGTFTPGTGANNYIQTVSIQTDERIIMGGQFTAYNGIGRNRIARLDNCTTPTVASTSPGSRCGTGTVVIGATPSAGSIYWYDAASGGTLLGTGTSFTTPSISTNTTYYAEAKDFSCISVARTAVTATVNTLPTVTASATETFVYIGTSVTLTGGGAVSYVWTGGVTDAVPFAAMSTQTYTVTGTDINGCTNTATKTITVSTVPLTKLSVASCGATGLLLSNTISCIAVTGAQNYQYIFVNGTDTVKYTRGTTSVSMPLSAPKYLNYSTTYNVKVRAMVAGSWGVYGINCTITLGTAPLAMLTGTCPKANVDIASTLYSTTVTGTLNRHYIFVNGTDTLHYYRGNGSTNIYLGNVTGIHYNKTYSVRVQLLIGTVWGLYGTACSITTKAIPTTTIMTTYCGTTNLTKISALKANVVVGATAYGFIFVNGTDTVKYEGSTNRVVLGNVSTLLASTTYNVKVRIKSGTAWGNYGAGCNITTAASYFIDYTHNKYDDMNVMIVSDTVDVLNTVEVFPNPVTGNNIYLEINRSDDAGELSTIKVVDLFGREIYRSQVELTEYKSSVTIELNNEMANGIYFVEVVTANNRSTERITLNR